MKQRILTFILGAGCIVLGVIAFLVYMGQDHRAPEITIKEAEITYQEGSNYGELMEGVSAMDNIDGDLTSEVFVEKIIPTEDGKATVYYGVTDDSNNVGRARRTVAYEEAGDMAPEIVEAETEPEVIKEEDEGDKKDTEELKPNGQRPAIALTETEATIKAGASFDVLSVVENAVDDKDSRDTLYQHIHADGNYNTLTKGTYSIRYYVTDSDGNASEVQVFTLKVE